MPGVTKVRNNLTVGDPKEAQNAQPRLRQTRTTTVRKQRPIRSPAQMRRPAQIIGRRQRRLTGRMSSPQVSTRRRVKTRKKVNTHNQRGTIPAAGAVPAAGSARTVSCCSIRRAVRSTAIPYPPQYRQPVPQYRQATGPITIPNGTLLQLRTMEPVASKHARDGEPVQFTLISDVSLVAY